MSTSLKTKLLCKTWKVVKYFDESGKIHPTHLSILSFYKSGTVVYVNEKNYKVGKWKWKDEKENAFHLFKKFIPTFDEEPDVYEIVSLTTTSLKAKVANDDNFSGNTYEFLLR